MAVMASSFMDKPSIESRPVVTSAGIITVTVDTNGATPDPSSLENGNSTPEQTVTLADEQPSLVAKSDNDNASDLDMTIAPADEVTNGIAPVAPFLPDPTPNSDPITGIPPLVDAPTSAIRADSSEELPQLSLGANPDIMDTTGDTTTSVQESQIVLTPETDTKVHNATRKEDPAPQIDALAPIEPTTTNNASIADVDEKMADSTGDIPPTTDEAMSDAPSQSKVRAREDDDVEQRSPKRVRTADAESIDADPPASGMSKVEPTIVSEQIPPIAQESTTAETPSTDTAPATTQVIANTQYTPILAQFDSEPLLPRQKAGLLRVLQNAKKAKAALAFKEPVDPVALGIPTYPSIVSHPMDLKTMETKLKNDKYGTVDEFISDMCQMVKNSFLFNGSSHPVSTAGTVLEAFMARAIKSNATRGSVQVPQPAKPAPSAPTKKETRRRSTTKSEKPVIPHPAPVAASPTTYAPIDGVPIIRRDSTTNDGRPKREIQRPKPRDLPYSVKPKKKKFQIELRFCEHVMNEVKKQKYARISWPFANPVDPVALNIPTYHKVIKKPMDMSTIDKKLKQGDYQTSKDFKADFDLMFANCFKFNPDNDEINKMGKEFQAIVNELWAGKETWIANHQPPSDPVSSAEESDDDEASDDEQDTRQRDLLDIQRQIAMLNSQAQQIIESATKQASPKAHGKKNGKTGKSSKQKKNSGGTASSKPGKSKKAKNVTPLTFQQKQEISESISELSEADMGKAMQIIRNGCPNLSNGNDEELEIDMEMIPEDVLRQLYKFVRNKRPSMQKNDEISDDEFEPPKSAAPKTTKSKKNKPMNKKEQEDSIEAIKRQLETFKQGGSGSEEPVSPANQDDSSSDDDAASESEEE
ncbi:Bromodomain-containing protein [Pseudovirgaria hyperparasitica]|uniref:Bromodomain-containing protein n=1 Tax=Pseudovirgaria hyperparasitica TaxID=470096 RepID=A0A6A6WD51_9PEZI|nr:Bromodomain-containing protein [Pseudovirgaria hyperparasitica]KAF2760633.1 Bromodomain-containing protein [Pseudovirgaria hyperparasitica]